MRQPQQWKSHTHKSFLIGFGFLFCIAAFGQLPSDIDKEIVNYNENNEFKNAAIQNIPVDHRTEISKRMKSNLNISSSHNNAGKYDVTTKMTEKRVPLEADDVVVLSRKRHREWNIKTLLNEQISNFINETVRFNYSGIEGTVGIRDLRVSEFQPPDISIVQFNEPHSILLDMANLHVTLDGHFILMVAELPLTGSMLVDLQEMTISLTTDVIEDDSKNNSFRLNVSSCTTDIKESRFSVDAELPFKKVIKRHEAEVNSVAQKELPNFLCVIFKRILDQRGVHLMQLLLEEPLIGDASLAETNKLELMGAFQQKLELCKSELCQKLKASIKQSS